MTGEDGEQWLSEGCVVYGGTHPSEPAGGSRSNRFCRSPPSGAGHGQGQGGAGPGQVHHPGHHAASRTDQKSSKDKKFSPNICNKVEMTSRHGFLDWWTKVLLVKQPKLGRCQIE